MVKRTTNKENTMMRENRVTNIVNARDQLNVKQQIS